MPAQIFNSVSELAQESFAGELVYWLSSGKLNKPHYLRNDYEIPSRYLHCNDGSDSEAPATYDTSITKKSECYPMNSSSTDEKMPQPIIVTWDSEDDKHHPRNWRLSKKAIVSFIMGICTQTLYMGAAIYTPGQSAMLEHFGTTTTKLALGVTLFIWGYGISSLWVAPMSENPIFGGRLYVYVASHFLFIIFQIPTALTNHVAPFAVLRLLAGCMAAPCLNTGAATYADLFAFPQLAYAIIIWGAAAISGPFIGPILGASMFVARGWRMIFWFLAILAGFIFIFLVLLFPETNEQALLMKKARYLRKRLNNPNIVSEWEILGKNQKTSHVLKHIFWRPLELTIKEPVLALLDIHLALVYFLFYLFFESFPLVFDETYHWTTITQTCAYLAMVVGIVITAGPYGLLLHKKLVQPIKNDTKANPIAIFSSVAILASLLIPVGMLIFGWTSSPRIHWIVPLIGLTIWGSGCWVIFQAYLSLIGSIYPPSRVASAYASNGIARAMLGGAAPLFGRALFHNISIDDFPIGWGSTILGIIALALLGLPIYLLIKGNELRNRAYAKYGGGDPDA